MKDFDVVAGESTCQKRIVVCELLTLTFPGSQYGPIAEWGVVARESNRCEPLGVCPRLGQASMKEGYALVSSCNWAHAEIRALASVPPGAKPTKAVIYGHDFPCPYCEIALRAAGIKNIEINKDKYKGTVGLRNTNG